MEPVSVSNEAIVQYLGYQSGLGFPQRREDHIRAAFGEQADELLAVIEKCLHDLRTFEPRWDSESLDEASARLRIALRATRPWITGLALDALIWKFSYDWK